MFWLKFVLSPCVAGDGAQSSYIIGFGVRRTGPEFMRPRGFPPFFHGCREQNLFFTVQSTSCYLKFDRYLLANQEPA